MSFWLFSKLRLREVVAERSGYGNNIIRFENELKQACSYIGITYQTFGDLLKPAIYQQEELGNIIAPDSPSQL